VARRMGSRRPAFNQLLCQNRKEDGQGVSHCWQASSGTRRAADRRICGVVAWVTGGCRNRRGGGTPCLWRGGWGHVNQPSASCSARIVREDGQGVSHCWQASSGTRRAADRRVGGEAHGGTSTRLRQLLRQNCGEQGRGDFTAGKVVVAPGR
jgi:hypothetical protein